jgi:hypothetical protein
VEIGGLIGEVAVAPRVETTKATNIKKKEIPSELTRKIFNK